MSDSLTLARKFRSNLLHLDAAAHDEVLRAYQAIWRHLSDEIERVAKKLRDGGNSPSLLFQHDRLQKLQDELAIEIVDVAKKAGAITLREQSRVVELARAHSLRLMQAAAVDRPRVRVNFGSLPKDELRHLVGVMQDGTPVAQAFRKLGADLGIQSGDAVKNALLEGMAMGSNPRRIAAAVRRQVDEGFTPGRVTRTDPRVVRALNMGIRHQVLGAYREATRLSYEDNQRLLSGWVWTATRSATTCVICWAMDGTVFPPSESLVSHFNCRCVMRPLLPGQSPGEKGKDAFRKLEPGVQKEILGELAFKAYDADLVELTDFVGMKSNPRWGDSRVRLGLEEIIGKREVENLRLSQ